ncbi:MAG: C69 family dipeptidase [Bacteroidetes bacterium]|nr:C69 family dipeptidase [Bacteroidota bacterium]
MNDYGYASEGESFSISDPDEVWIMEIIGKGRNYKITQKTLDTLSGDTIPFEIVSELEKLKGKTFLKEKEFEAAVAKLIGKEEAEKYIKRFMQDAENTQRGAVWVAMKVPEGYICAHANQARITTFTYQKKNKWDDPAAIVFNAPDVITFAKQKGYYNGTDPLFSFSDVYAPVDFGGARRCEIRVWSFFKSLDSDFRKKKEYWEYVKGNVQHKVAHKEGEPLTPDNFAGNRLPLWIKPDKKVTLTQMMDAMRDHLEGTELDMRKDIGAGPFECPYRWRPLTWKVDTVVYCNERATATQQTGFSFIAQARAGLTSPVGGIFWFGVDDAASTVYVPMYCGITKVPEAYAHGNGSMMDFSFDAAFWVFNMVSNFAYTRYNVIWPEIRTKQQALEKKSIESVRDVDKKAEKLMKGGKKEEALALMTDFSVKIGNETHKEWLNLYMYLFTKYMDGNIKEKAELPENHIYVPAKLEQPGYGENWYKKIADETGDKFKVKGSAH